MSVYLTWVFISHECISYMSIYLTRMYIVHGYLFYIDVHQKWVSSILHGYLSYMGICLNPYTMYINRLINIQQLMFHAYSGRGLEQI